MRHRMTFQWDRRSLLVLLNGPARRPRQTPVRSSFGGCEYRSATARPSASRGALGREPTDPRAGTSGPAGDVRAVAGLGAVGRARCVHPVRGGRTVGTPDRGRVARVGRAARDGGDRYGVREVARLPAAGGGRVV